MNMRLLKKTAWVIGLMVLLAVIKLMLDRLSPGSVVFHRNLLTGLQWLLLLGLVWWLLLQLLWRILFKKDFSFGAAWVMLLLVLGAGEWACLYYMKHAARVSPGLHAYLLKYYVLFERQLPEVMPGCAQYDPQLTYVYKPGAALLHRAPEFSDSITINAGGLRDDDASLVRPQVICLGDSYTAGVGVRQQQTYAQVLERTTGLKVLNAGVSSYGTARELMLYRRLDTTAMQYLVIQYCYNDLEENIAYVQNGRQLKVRSRQAYDTLVNAHYWATRYYPLKRALTISRMMAKGAISNPAPETPKPGALLQATAANTFLDILYHSGMDFDRTRVLVVDISKYPVFDAQRVAQSAAYSEAFRKNVRFIDMAPLGDPSLYYPLDNHLNAKGHALLASLIHQEILRNPAALP